MFVFVVQTQYFSFITFMLNFVPVYGARSLARAPASLHLLPPPPPHLSGCSPRPRLGLRRLEGGRGFLGLASPLLPYCYWPKCRGRVHSHPLFTPFFLAILYVSGFRVSWCIRPLGHAASTGHSSCVARIRPSPFWAWAFASEVSGLWFMHSFTLPSLSAMSQ